MILSFTEFLLESIEFDRTPSSTIEHDHHIGKDHVKVYFIPGHKKPEFYHVGFQVNNHDSRIYSGVRNPKILQHVRNVVHAFIQQRKPQGLRFEAEDIVDEDHAAKAKVYRRFARELETKYGADYKTAEGDRGIQHILRFRRSY